MNKPELDLEMIQRLYKSGGLLAHRVVVFHHIPFTIKEDICTFNLDEAQAQGRTER